MNAIWMRVVSSPGRLDPSLALRKRQCNLSKALRVKYKFIERPYFTYSLLSMSNNEIFYPLRTSKAEIGKTTYTMENEDYTLDIFSPETKKP